MVVRLRRLDDYGDALSVQDVYDILPVGMNSVRKLITDGTIKSVKVGSRYIIPKVSLVEWLCGA